MNKSKILLFIIAILIGVLMIVYGEIDDSPGGQFIGLLAIIIGIAGLVKSKKKILDKETHSKWLHHKNSSNIV